jgi:acyl-CoA thioesterase FadM
VIEEDRIGFPTVSVQSDFYRPLRYGDDLEITVVISGVGRSSVTFEFSISRDGLSEALVKSSVKKVALDLDSWQRIDIPDKYREAFMKCGAD